MTALVFVTTALWWYWCLAKPRATTGSFADEFWDGVMLIAPLLAFFLSALQAGGLIKDRRGWVWATISILLTSSVWGMYIYLVQHQPPSDYPAS